MPMADNMQDRDEELIRETNKRLSLNLLIQGAAAHSCLTAHHLVRDELESIHEGIVHLYDQAVVGLFLNYFIGDVPLVYGRPSRFWNNVGQPGSPFCDHPFIVAHGKSLWQASKRQLVERAKEKQVAFRPVLHYPHALSLFLRVSAMEKGHKAHLEQLAKEAASTIWKIPEERLDAQLTRNVAFGNLREPVSKVGRITMQAAVGFGGVRLEQDHFQVVAKAWLWPLLTHELIKGTAELVCLHGLSELNDATYANVLDRADHIEYETWMLQAGPNLWRRFLAAKPATIELSTMLMRVAKLTPVRLEELLFQLMRDDGAAEQTMAAL